MGWQPAGIAGQAWGEVGGGGRVLGDRHRHGGASGRGDHSMASGGGNNKYKTTFS